MIVDIVMPKMGESITEGTILEWRKKVGEFVEKDELFLEIGTDKVDSEIPCVESGILVEILADVNDVVEVGKTIAKIETKTPAINESEPPASQEKSLDNSKEESKEIIEKDISQKENFRKSTAPKKTTNFVTRAVMKAAREKNISMEELHQIKGTGRKGRITKKDILGYVKQKTFSNEPVIDKKADTLSFASATHTEEMDNMRTVSYTHLTLPTTPYV